MDAMSDTVFSGKEIPFEETLPDGTIRRGTLRLIDDPDQVELTILRELAAAVDRFQYTSKYTSGDFAETYQIINKYKAWRFNH